VIGARVVSVGPDPDGGPDVAVVALPLAVLRELEFACLEVGGLTNEYRAQTYAEQLAWIRAARRRLEGAEGPPDCARCGAAHPPDDACAEWRPCPACGDDWHGAAWCGRAMPIAAGGLAGTGYCPCTGEPSEQIEQVDRVLAEWGAPVRKCPQCQHLVHDGDGCTGKTWPTGQPCGCPDTEVKE
jgi:hypothetical protein